MLVTPQDENFRVLNKGIWDELGLDFFIKISKHTFETHTTFFLYTLQHVIISESY